MFCFWSCVNSSESFPSSSICGCAQGLKDGSAFTSDRSQEMQKNTRTPHLRKQLNPSRTTPQRNRQIRPSRKWQWVYLVYVGASLEHLHQHLLHVLLLTQHVDDQRFKRGCFCFFCCTLLASRFLCQSPTFLWTSNPRWLLKLLHWKLRNFHSHAIKCIIGLILFLFMGSVSPPGTLLSWERKLLGQFLCSKRGLSLEFVYINIENALAKLCQENWLVGMFSFGGWGGGFQCVQDLKQQGVFFQSPQGRDLPILT